MQTLVIECSLLGENKENVYLKLEESCPDKE